MQIKQEIKNDLTLFGMEILEIITRTLQPTSFVLAVMIGAFTAVFTIGVTAFEIIGTTRNAAATHPLIVIGVAIPAYLVCMLVHRVTKVINKRFTKLHDEKERLFEQLNTKEGRGEAIRQYIRAFRE